MPLFNGIISDLFPGIELPEPDFGVFLDALKDNIAKKNLQPVPWFIEKIVQVRNAGEGGGGALEMETRKIVGPKFFLMQCNMYSNRNKYL